MKLLQKILLVLLLFGAMSYSYSNTFELTGVVKNVNTNEPIADHLVYIAPLDGADTIATTTDAEGYFYKELQMSDSGMFLGSVITLDPCTGELNYEIIAIDDSGYFIEFALCGGYNADCQAMYEYFNGISSVGVEGIDSLPYEDYTVQFINVSTPADSYLWNFGDSTVSFEESPLHTFPAGGDYEVSLTITNDSCESTYTSWIWVDEPYNNCNTWFSYSYGIDSVWFENDSINSGGESLLEVQFYDYSMQENEYWNWNFGDGATSTEKNPVHIYEKPGIYHVSLEAGNDECASTSEQTIFLETPSENCKAALEYVIGEYSENDSINMNGYRVEFFDVSIGNPDTWRWDFGDGEISNEQNPVHYYQAPGFYSIVLFAGNDSCFSTTYEWLSVIGNGGPDSVCMADFIMEYENCIGDSISGECVLFPMTFHNISMGNFTDWYWDFGDGSTSTEQSPVHVYEPGEYEIKLIASGPDCESEFYEYLYVGDGPIDTIWKPEGCLAMFYPMITNEHTVEFINESYGEIDYYFWDFGDGTTSTEPSPVHEYEDIDEWYLVTLTIESADSCSSTFVMELWLDDYESDESLVALFIPEIDGSTVVFHNESQGEIKNVHWDFGDGTTTDAYEAVHTYSDLGTYIVTLGISNDDAVTTFTMEIDLVNETFKGLSSNAATGVREVKNKFAKLTANPNPVKAFTNIKIESNENAKANLQLLNIAGQIVMQNQVELVKGDNNFSVNTESLKQGVYLLNVVTPTQAQSLKITK